MRALVLAAGEGRRLRPLTSFMPKPLVPVGGVPLIVRQIRALAEAGVDEIVVNTAYGSRILEALLGEGSGLGVRIRYSREGIVKEDALETLGGIVKALPLLRESDEEAFIVVAADIATDYDYKRLVGAARNLRADGPRAHLVLVGNPVYHPEGDFALDADGRISTSGGEKKTFSSLGAYRYDLFEGLEPERAKLFPWLLDAAGPRGISGEVHQGWWANVGDPNQWLAACRRCREAGC